jgi:hypothetical protein
VNRIPVLTYHSLHAPGDEYTSNDHIALETDLHVIRAMNFNVVPLADIARYVAGDGAAHLDVGSWVGLSFDDGPDWDYHDFRADGRSLKSFHTILREAADLDHGFRPCAVSFVIASPDARETLDRLCIAGNNNWRDTWWEEAAAGGVLAVGNHSWDHAHPDLPSPDRHRANDRDSFSGIDCFERADRQIAKAEVYIRSRIGNLSTRLFAYPYGDAPDYLVREYFPNYREHHGMIAAFHGNGEYVTSAANRWKIPRFECREHWKSPEELARILAGAGNLAVSSANTPDVTLSAMPSK